MTTRSTVKEVGAVTYAVSMFVGLFVCCLVFSSCNGNEIAKVARARCCVYLTEHFDQLDINKDGELTLDEIQEARRQLQITENYFMNIGHVSKQYTVKLEPDSDEVDYEYAISREDLK